MITDQEAIERAAELGMLAGQDLAKAREQLVPGAHIDGAIRALVYSHITEVLAAFDAHDPGIYRAADVEAAGDLYRCPDGCGGFVGTEAEWKRHLADKLADALTQADQS